MMKNTTKLLDQIAELKEYRHQIGKALARIESWHDRLGQGVEPSETLEMILRIFKEEMNR